MNDGFSVFIGAAGAIMTVFIVLFVYGIAVDNTKQVAIERGYLERSGAVFSVKPAKTLRAE